MLISFLVWTLTLYILMLPIRPSKVGYFNKIAEIFSTAKNGPVYRRQLKIHIFSFSMFSILGTNLWNIFFYILSFFFSESRWTVSSYIVFPVTGLVVTSLLVVVLIEKFTCVPKRLSRLILHLTGNKMLHQLMAITNTLTLLSCVLLPMVRLLHFHWICPQWGQILWKNAAALVH